MNGKRFGTRLAVSILGAAMLAGLTGARLLAHDGHTQAAAAQATTQKADINALVAVVREVTEPYKNVAVADAAGYKLQFGCVSGPDFGAMGLHYVNFPLVIDGLIDARQPEIVIYEPAADGGVRLVGADYLVFADEWDSTHTSAPVLMGQIFHRFDAPNRFGLPAFYTLHVWAWKESPTGTFVNWHANVSCDAFTGDTN